MKNQTIRYKLDAIMAAHGNKCAACGLLFTGENSHLFDLHHKVSTGESSRGRPPSVQMRGSQTTEEFVKLALEVVPLCKNCHARVHHEKLKYATLDEAVIKVIASTLYNKYSSEARAKMMTKKMGNQHARKYERDNDNGTME